MLKYLTSALVFYLAIATYMAGSDTTQAGTLLLGGVIALVSWGYFRQLSTP